MNIKAMASDTQQYKSYRRSGKYPEIRALVTYLKRGKESGIFTQETTNTKQRERTDRILRAIVACGWKEEFVTTLLTNMTDQMIPFKKDQDFVEAFLKELVVQSRQMDVVCDALRRIGLSETSIAEIRDVMTPLEYSCYTDDQMIEESIEYLVGRYQPMTAPATIHATLSSQTNTWIHGYADESSEEDT